MDYKCNLCGEVVKDDLKEFVEHTENHIIDLIKKDHPDWVENNGLCRKCHDYHKRELRGRP